MFRGHGAQGALAGGDDGRGGVGEAQHGRQAVIRTVFQAVLKHVVEHAGAEGIPRAGGLDGAAQAEGRDVDPMAATVGIAAVGSGGDVQQADVREPPLEDGRAGKTIEWETLEMFSRELEIPREHFLKRWAQ